MIVLLLLLNIKCIACILNIPFENSDLDEEISKSILEISRRYFSKSSHIFIQSLSMERNLTSVEKYNDTYLLSRMHNELEIPVILYKYNDYVTWKITKPLDAQALVIILPKTHIQIQIKLFLRFINKIWWDILYPRMYVSVVSPTVPTSDREAITATYHVLNSIWSKLREANAIYILPRAKRDDNSLVVCSWYPERQLQEICLKILYNFTVIISWMPEKSNFSQDEDIFPSKDIKDMGRCFLSVSLYNMPPYIIVTKQAAFGFLKEILVTLLNTNKINLIPHMKEIDDNKKCDICLPLPLLPNYYWKVRKFATYPLFVHSHSWYVPIIPILKWQSIIRIFSVEMWTMVAVTFLLGTITFWLLKGKNDPIKVFIDTLRTLLCFGIPQNFEGALSTIFFSLWLFFCLQINTAYQSGLIAFLAEPGTHQPITSIEELESSGFIKESSLLFENDSISFSADDYFLQKLPYCGNAAECFDRMIQHKKIAMYGSTMYTDMIMKYISSDKKRPEIASLKPAFSITPFSTCRLRTIANKKN
ncbi:hypothetical protein L9F63_006733 [Diploptera punctata]|uniref:Uncharacterized protein n=1 Tax=Diploptera punctata TaxID=6984 RepID=A0AAD7ZA29_DIPPU|nr:hypothetical protein L9F63_006733 [Diploptera punctata]